MAVDIPNTQLYSDVITLKSPLAELGRAWKGPNGKHTIPFLVSLLFHTSGLHIVPHLLSYCTPDSIGSDDHITLVDGLVFTMNHDFVWKMLYLGDSPIHHNSVFVVDEALVQDPEQNLAIQESGGITVSVLRVISDILIEWGCTAYLPLVNDGGRIRRCDALGRICPDEGGPKRLDFILNIVVKTKLVQNPCAVREDTN